ncbi:MAG: AAA family ATPase [Deltaproteobacteria bacterium]|nr:AAA family ATPase [Deltaproteobacteria bacterium]
MRLLQYKDLDLRRVRPAFDKVRAAIEAGDFRSADVKKLHAGSYYRAKLDYSNRLLLQFARVGGDTVCLALEVIENHAYDRSRFLRGAAVDESKIEDAPVAEPAGIPGHDALAMRWLHPTRIQFELLDKPIVLDDAQDEVCRFAAPLVIVGSAGSGKTAVTIAKLREAEGRVLYVTLSRFLADTARSLYDAHGYDNPAQQVEFLSYREFLETLKVPAGREVSFRSFSGWFDRHRAGARAMGDVDAHALFEEFHGVIGAHPGGPLGLADYLALGPRQSLLAPAAREAAHVLFTRYLQWMAGEGLFDLNLVAHQWRPLAEAVYDFLVVDEVQDLTPVQLELALASLKTPGRFLLCGDSNQIVHPNFFSWAGVKTMFWHGLAGEAAQRQTVHVLVANYRNTRRVTDVANRLLKVKQSRFGSVDRETNFLVGAVAAEAGEVTLLPAKDAALKALDAASRGSVKHAVIVLRDEDKVAARARFRTPLLFSVHEAKGLEYPHVVLFEMVSSQRSVYAEVCEGVSPSDVASEGLEYRRARDKGDKSLELFKFYVNALYVAMTRAVETLTLVESDASHPLFGLLGLETGEARTGDVRTSTKEEWAQEARKLELQGKDEQARAIRDTFLQSKPVPWTSWNQSVIEELAAKAFDGKYPGSKPRQTLLDYALWHGQHRWIERLARAEFSPAKTLVRYGEFLQPGVHLYGLEERQQRNSRMLTALRQRFMQAYAAKNFKDVLSQCEVYGVDHRTPVGMTPLMLGARAGNAALVSALLERGAARELEDEFGHVSWHVAVNRAMEDAAFAKGPLAALFDLLAPATIDVQTQGRLVRLERHQGEYWLLTLMLAGLKSQWSLCASREQGAHRFSRGFFAEQLHATLECLPQHLWKDKRRKRSYVSQVLARGEIESSYRPARQLWARAELGHYIPNPAMQVRRGDGWIPVYDALNLAWIDQGSGGGNSSRARPGSLVARLGSRVTARGEVDRSVEKDR